MGLNRAATNPSIVNLVHHLEVTLDLGFLGNMQISYLNNRSTIGQMAIPTGAEDGIS